MSDTKKTKEQALERDQRIIAHARNGHTMPEILDMEGLDKQNPARWHKLLRAHGLSSNTSRPSRPPIGLTKETVSWRYRLGRHLARLRDKHPQIELSRMIGMTRLEMTNATNASPTHDWTVSQIYRLSVATEIPFDELVIGAFKSSL